MKTKKEKDIDNVVRREKYFSTLAKKEGKGAKERLAKDIKRGYKESAKDDRKEVKIDYAFAKKRAKMANKIKEKR